VNTQVMCVAYVHEYTHTCTIIQGTCLYSVTLICPCQNLNDETTPVVLIMNGFSNEEFLAILSTQRLAQIISRKSSSSLANQLVLPAKLT